ncbi:Ribose 5-phosphate isomerase B [Bacillus badius]|uniref:Ribose 5-phosphate isomerase B n=1 Tax=Bacillus badius TaxID=1455 RepID=A0ABR5ANL0_BACBA|nr:Ribose 5-phosphate isomerase B [Bacillus badius]
MRPRTRFGAEEAHRPPRGKRSAWNGNQPGPSARKIKSTANVSFSSLITAGGFHFQTDIAVRHPLFCALR